METSAEAFVPLLIQSRLLDAEAASTALELWHASVGESANDAAHWRSWLVEQNLLTEYQSSLLGRGHTEGYFLHSYKILDRIGRGRMAGVYRATDASGNVVAIKVLPPSKAKDPVLLARFQREARFAERFAHLNVVRAQDVGEVDGFNYLVMDYLDGETLDSILKRRGKLGIEESIDLLEQALCGLQHIHEHGLVHRDLKPGNMMIVACRDPGQLEVTIGGILKILDFGLCRGIDDVGPEPAQDMHLTAAGAMLGTPDYLAPEQARDARSADIRADIYSLGCVGFHLLTGRPPFPDKNAVRQMVRHATEPLPALAQIRPGTPVFLQEMLNRMLAKVPSERYSTPAEALRTVRESSRQTETFVAAVALGSTLARLESPLVASDLTTPDAPTTKQEVFRSFPAEAATKTVTSSNTPLEIDETPKKKSTEVEVRAAQAPGHRSERKPKTTTHARSTQERRVPNKGTVPSIQNESLESAWRWTRRDAVMFVAGAASVLIAMCLGALFSWITRSD